MTSYFILNNGKKIALNVGGDLALNTPGYQVNGQQGGFHNYLNAVYSEGISISV